MPSLHNTPKPKQDVSSWIGYPLVCLLLAAALWRVEFAKDSQQPGPTHMAPKVDSRESLSTWEEVVTVLPAVLRQLL
ncbi:MAG TPA: hypothetical protein VL547_10725 [Dinghuibacter sp.]|jgi:hypothetical protein|uniref:hypothetical protein n=1 Tax=Dinghuibacter sp. TaxID=2024697 RepID=UPI002D10CFD6|nr:hypothetical protein [Dinghuibacter sp.]HTJ12492.1 hypothetical protein [Dinghuibacter sp.]